MGVLTRSLTDRARVVRQVPAGPRVDGMSPMEPVHHHWIRCRLVPTDAPEIEDTRGGRATVQQRAQLVCGTDALDVQPTGTLEVHSRLLGDGTWRIAGQPQRATTIRTVRAVIVPIVRVIEPVRDSVLWHRSAHPRAGRRGGARHAGGTACGCASPRPGRASLAKAAAELEAALPAIAEPHLTEWAESIERNAKRHKGIE